MEESSFEGNAAGDRASAQLIVDPNENVERSRQESSREGPEEEVADRSEGGDVAVEVIDYAGAGAGAIPGNTAGGGGDVINVVEGAQLGGGSMTVSQTKVTTTIEKSKYVGPCGSACGYSGETLNFVLN